MNWLAHVFLSRPKLGYKLGNLLADRISREELQGYSEDFAAGVRCHMAIDKYTDSHEMVRRSKGRVFSKYRHFAPVLVDVYYDHILVKHWDRFSDISYYDYVEAFYDAIEAADFGMGATSRDMLMNIVRYDVLGCYDSVLGVDRALKRMAHRVKKPRSAELARGVDGLIENMEGFEEDFLEFFPQLQNHVEGIDFYKV